MRGPVVNSAADSGCINGAPALLLAGCGSQITFCRLFVLEKCEEMKAEMKRREANRCEGSEVHQKAVGEADLLGSEAKKRAKEMAKELKEEREGVEVEAKVEAKERAKERTKELKEERKRVEVEARERAKELKKEKEVALALAALEVPKSKGVTYLKLPGIENAPSGKCN
jgi:hypothetical protein